MTHRKLATYALSISVSLLMTACGDDDSALDASDHDHDHDNDADTHEGDPDAGDGDGDGDAGAITLPDIEEDWTAIEPGGETTCARGDTFRFFVRGGTLNKVAIVFDGGGACWDATTCGLADAIFSPTADEMLPDPGDGIGDNTDPENPFKDWYQVFIPYCTGDIHWGDNVATYEPDGGAPEITIQHKGQANVNAVLDWVYENFERPDSVFVTGMSAGAYASIGWAPHIIEHYPDSYVAQLGDCGAGVITDTFFEDSFPSWHADSLIPDWIPGLDIPLSELALEDLYIEVASYYPDHFFGQYNTHNDENQRFYYTAMGGLDEDWSPKMYEKVQAIVDGAPNFRVYIAGGIQHVVLPYPEFYTYTVGDTRLRDWVADIANGEPVENVFCEDPNCEEPEIYEP